MSNRPSSAAPSQFRRRWHTTTFRWLCVYTALFGIVLTLLVGFIAWTASATIERDADSIMAWQLIYFDSIPDAQLPEAIYQRLEHERMHVNYCGLFTADGRYVAGDLLEPPPHLTYTREGSTHAHTMKLLDRDVSPVVRAMGEVRPSGMRLIVARDMTSVLRIRKIVVRTLIAGAVVALLAAVASGLVLGMRQIRRVREIRRVTECIARGDLDRRLPVGGDDELDMLAHLVNHMLDEVERLMGEVKGACDGIAHDLRTPLVHLHTLLARVAERESVRADGEGAALMERARTETGQLLERFRAMLRISEIGTLQRRGGFATVDLYQLVQELAELYEPLAESRDLEWRIAAEPVAEIHGDRALLFEAFNNLIDNAIKFAPQGGVVSITLRSTPLGPLLEVADNGPGIAPGERAAVLQRFYRGDTVRHIAGSGLGLSVVAAVMRVHDFTLRIDDARDLTRAAQHGAGNEGGDGGEGGPGTRMSVECWPRSLA
ncbi:signal transduction histidine kinase [Paraburkholderia unamae]|uniref:sensor histidine kinase n=1 Tax=Paraburkholderia unamae TaxID=219649 RepID=UPI000DC603D1|nr:HAMP domain-containing sensor histidine kinase [Paraburkholderia unamae]RAR51373.1 signal transduction histidine kinase [Paraburkholderia unamae]